MVLLAFRMNARIDLHKRAVRPCQTTFASYYLFVTTTFSFIFLQQGEFVAQRPAATQQQIRSLQSSNAAAAVPQQTEVPDVTKHKVEEAQRMLRDVKLLMGQPQFVTTPQPSGTVVRQYPEAHSKIKIGATVYVWVSTEKQTSQPPPPGQPSQGAVPTPRLVLVPTLIHHRKDDAVQLLKFMGLQVSWKGIQETPSEEETGIVLTQEPPPGDMVRPGTFVSFTVSRQIERALVLRGFPTSIAPGGAVTLSAELNPPFPGTEYQFTSGVGTLAPTTWTTDAQAQFVYPTDGDYEATAAARWNNGSVSSNVVHIVVHPVKYEVLLLADPLDVKLGQTVSFRATVSPAVQRADYVYHFGDSSANETSSSATVQYTYKTVGNYSACVIARIADGPEAGGPAHSHDFASSPVRLSVVPSNSSVTVYVIGAVALVGVLGYAIRRFTRPSGPQVVAHWDPGVQKLKLASQEYQRVDIEIHVMRSWGGQKIDSQGPLCARTETIHE